METSPGHRDLRLILAGLQAGCLGSLLMIGWWVLGEVLLRRSAWTIPNLLATSFYGERAYRSGFHVPTLSGLAITFTVYTAAGMLFALAGRERQRSWLLIAVGVATGLALNWLLFSVVFQHLNPLAELYMPDRLVTISHLLYGTALASYPGYFRRFEPTPEPPPLPVLLDQQIGRGIPEPVVEPSVCPVPFEEEGPAPGPPADQDA